jgi:hypothetical protein
VTRVVHRFRLSFDEPSVLSLPAFARVVHAGMKPHAAGPDVWVEGPACSDALVSWTLRIIATGEQIEGGWEHACSFVMGDGLVWHVYRLGGAS